MTTHMLPATHKKQVVLAHGGGGQLTDDLIREVIRPRFNNLTLAPLDDAAILNTGDRRRLAFTTDSYVVQPLEFPGADIGRIAVCGTVNDLAVSGAVPRWISLGLIIEEGFDIHRLARLLDSAARAAMEADVHVVTGDTKVVARGQADGLYINTAGIGLMADHLELGPTMIREGDVVLINGPIADHGLAVMLQREDALSIRSTLRSDAAPLADLVAAVMAAAPNVRFMRDPTRGGVAGVMADLAEQSGQRIMIDESRIPVRPDTLYAAEMLGIDPLDVANEGKLIAVVPPDEVEGALAAMRASPNGRDATAIGEVGSERDGLCEMLTDVGGRRVIQKPYGEQLPRIC